LAKRDGGDSGISITLQPRGSFRLAPRQKIHGHPAKVERYGEARNRTPFRKRLLVAMMARPADDSDSSCRAVPDFQKKAP